MEMSPSGMLAASVFLIAVGMIAGYVYGYRRGRADGHASGVAEGKEQTKREVSIKAFAAGFERGRQRASEEKKSGSGSRGGLGCCVFFLGGILLALFTALTLT